MRSFLVALLALSSTVPIFADAGQLPVMPVGLILEERFRDDDLAVVVPDRLELICESSPSSEWNFSFPSFETKWQGPIELEVTGSGGYAQQDVFSIAALAIDYGGKEGWIERSHFGLGLIQGSRNPHPPSFGVGGSGKFIMRGNLVNAGPEPQKITIDPAKYAPKGWDGRLWIGLMLHNTGRSKSLKVRVLNARPASGTLAPEPDTKAKWELVRKHQHEFLKWRLEREMEDASRTKPAPVVKEMEPYLKAASEALPQSIALKQYQEAVKTTEEKLFPAEAFVKLVNGHYLPRANRQTDIQAQLNRFYQTWEKGGMFGREIGCIVRTISNLEKVSLTDVQAGRVVKAAPEPVRISAARHEYEGFQIVLSPLADCRKKVSISVTDLKAGKAVIPSSNVTINPVGYIRIFPGQPQEQLCPDPLLHGSIPELKAGENQPVWITVYVPENAKPGEYRGSVVISSEGADKLQIPLVLKVHDFNVPKKISLRSSFWMFRDQLNRFYHLDEVKFDDYMKWIDFALEHRLCPIDVYEGRCAQLLDIIKDGKPNPNPDFTNWDRYIDRMIAGGANTIHLGQSHHHGSWFSSEKNPTSSPEQVKMVIESLKTLSEHYKKRGIFDLHYMQLRDETSAPESLNVYREVGKQLPDLKLLLTAPSGEARPLLQILCPLTPGFDPGWRDEVKKKGGEYWWYVCCSPADPNWPNLFIHQTAVQHRALFWQTWKNNVDGLLYWGLNFWSWYKHEYPENASGPVDRVPPAGSFNFCPLQDVPGDGFSIYPGPSPSRPMSSVRLEIMRDGEEDYEYFLLLDRLITEAESKGSSDPALKEAKAARKAAAQLVPGLTNYERDSEPYLKVREQVADAIEKLIR